MNIGKYTVTYTGEKDLYTIEGDNIKLTRHGRNTSYLIARCLDAGASLKMICCAGYSTKKLKNILETGFC